MAKRTPIQRGLWFMVLVLVGLVLWGIKELFSTAATGVISIIVVVFLAVGGVGMLVSAIENACRKNP